GDVGRRRAAADEADDALLGIVGVDPLEAFASAVAIMERGELAVDAVELADEELDPAVGRAGRAEVPIEALVVVPLAPLAELAAHEEQLLGGLEPLVGEKEAEVGELLPLVAGHAREEGALEVNDLVVRERDDVVLRVLVHAAEGE